MWQVCQGCSLVDGCISGRIVSPKHLTLYCSLLKGLALLTESMLSALQTVSVEGETTRELSWDGCLGSRVHHFVCCISPIPKMRQSLLVKLGEEKGLLRADERGSS